MPLSEDRRKQLDGIIQEMHIKKESDRNIQTVVSDFKSKYEVAAPKAPTFLQTIAKPFIRTAAAIPAVAESVYNLAKGDVGAAQTAITRPRDFGILGTSRPIGVSEKTPEKAMSLGQLSKQVVGTGAEIASYISPGAIGKGLITGAVKPTIKALSLGSGLSGGLALGGSAMAEDKEWGDILKDTAFGVGTGLTIGAALPVAGKFLKNTAGKAISTITRPLRGVEVDSTKIATGLGEFITGVDKDTWVRYADTLKSNPEKIGWADKVFQSNPDDPFKAYTENVANKISTIKKEAYDAYTIAKDEALNKMSGQKFDLQNRMPSFNQTLEEFNLKAKPTQEKGLLNVVPTTRTSPFTTREIGVVNDIVNKLNIRDLNVAELFDVDESIRKALDEYSKMDNKKMVALLSGLTEKSANVLDELIPGIDKANQRYKNYYDIMSDFGNKIVDSAGEIKNSAQGFVANLPNQNKGILRDKIAQYSQLLGVDLGNDTQILRDVINVNQDVARTVKNRFTDIVGALGITGGFIAGGPIGLVTGILFKMYAQSPKVYKKFVEWSTKKAKLPMPGEVRAFLSAAGEKLRGLKSKAGEPFANDAEWAKQTPGAKEEFLKAQGNQKTLTEQTRETFETPQAQKKTLISKPPTEKPHIDDDFVYHTTSNKALEKIKKTGGLKPSSGQYGRGVYFAPSEAKTGGYGSSEEVMLRVNREKLPADFQEWPGEQGWTENNVPNEAIEVKIGDKWEPLLKSSEIKRPPKTTALKEGEISVKRLANHINKETHDTRGGTWFMNDSADEKIVKDWPDMIGGEKTFTGKIKPKNPLVINNAILEEGSFNVINGGYENFLPKKYAKLATELSDKVAYPEEKITEDEAQKIAMDLMFEAGIPENQARSTLNETKNNFIDAVWDLIIGKGLKESGYDALILKAGNDQHIFYLKKTPNLKAKQ